MHVGVRVRRLVGDEQLDRRAEDGIGKFPRGCERLELVAEVTAEQVVDDGEHLRPRAVVHRQRQHALAGGRAPLAEDLDVGVPEPVDRLELVADDETLGPCTGDQVDQLALEPVRVLELVHHDRAEAPLLLRADRLVVAQQVAVEQLEVLEVERGLRVLRRAVGERKCLEQLLQQVAVGGGQLVERRLLDCPARFLVRRRALAANT